MPTNDYISETKEVLKQFICFIEDSPWKDDYLVRLQQLLANMDAPCRLAIAGRVKAGKSSLVNALLGINLAKVGETETTATINIFKSGTPPDSNKPVLCQYCDGHEEWVTKEFLDSLQGTSPEGLKKASEIKNLTYFVSDNKMLKNIILIDTPGTNALVREHEKQTELYFELRQRHNEETIDISNKADAVIYLVEEVPKKFNQDFLSSLKATMGQKSNVNTIVVMSQMDLHNRIYNKEKYAEDTYQGLSFYISKVIPISAGIKLFLPSKEEAIRMKSVLLSIFDSEEDFEFGMKGGSETFKLLSLSNVQLSVEEQKSLVGEMPWPVFVVIARELYKHDVDTALAKLEDYSGIDCLKTTIEKYFFERSDIIRCNTIISDVYHTILLYLDFKLKNTQDTLIKNRYAPIRAKIVAIKEKTDRINQDFDCLQKLNYNRDKFSIEEIEELTKLFAYNTTAQRDESRCAHWQSKYVDSMRKDQHDIVTRAYQKYCEL